MEIVHVFIDTNIFLHYRPVDDIPWRDIVGADSVVVCVAPIVVEELDDQKDTHRLTKIRDRARKALQLIERSVEENDFEIRNGVSLQYMSEPDISFSDHGLRREKNDDNLVASVLSLGPEAQNTAVLVTGDTGPRLKAARLGLSSMGLPHEYKRESALSETEKEKRQLQQELSRLRNRLPELDLVFDAGEKYCVYQVSEYDPLTEKEISIGVEDIKEQYPKKDYETIGKTRKPLKGSLAGFTGPSQQDIDRYNNRLDDFYHEYEKYLEARENIRGVKSRMITLNIAIRNIGSAPAADVDVFMHFPNGFMLFSDEDLPDLNIEEPQPPTEPKGGFLNIGGRMNAWSRHLSPDINLPPAAPPGNVSPPNIEETNSYKVNFRVQKLKHNMREDCGPYYVLFNSFDGASSFGIEYRINTADLADDTEGKLHVVVEKG